MVLPPPGRARHRQLGAAARSATGRHRPGRRGSRLDDHATATRQGGQRQQLNLLAYAAVLLAGYFLFAYLYTRGTIRRIPPLLDTAVSGLSLVVVPAAIGMAILRYRLYDLDRLINGTLVYGLLTVLLGLGYAASVLVFGQLAGRDQIQPRRGRRHPDRRRPVPAGPRPYSASCGSTPQPAPLRRRQDDRGVQRPPARRGDLATLTGELLAVAEQTVEPTRRRCGFDLRRTLDEIEE
jgi:hypothetical protein